MFSVVCPFIIALHCPCSSLNICYRIFFDISYFLCVIKDFCFPSFSFVRKYRGLGEASDFGRFLYPAGFWGNAVQWVIYMCIYSEVFVFFLPHRAMLHWMVSISVSLSLLMILVSLCRFVVVSFSVSFVSFNSNSSMRS